MGKIAKNKKVLFLLIFLGIFFVSFNILALEVDWPPSPVGTRLTDESTLTQLVQYLYEWGIALGGLAAFVALVIAGFYYLTSMGDPGKIREAKDRINSAVLGLILLMGSWIILHEINPELTTLTTPTLEPKSVETDYSMFMEDEKPCDFVRAYREVNYEGNHIDLKAELDPSWTPRQSDGVKSVRFFQKLEENEQCRNNRIIKWDEEIDEEVGTDIYCEYITSVTVENGYYKEGGACILEWAPWKTEWFGWIQGCGDKEPSISKSTNNLRIYTQEDKKTECLRVIRLPEKIRWNITVSPSRAGEICVNNYCTETSRFVTFDKGELVKFSARAFENYTFKCFGTRGECLTEEYNRQSAETPSFEAEASGSITGYFYKND